MSPETAGCMSGHGCGQGKMCIVYFFWTVLSEQNTEHKCKLILSPPYGPPLALDILCEADTDLSLRCSNPAKDAIAWTAQKPLSLPDPRANVCLTPCTWLLPSLALLSWSTEIQEEGVGWTGSDSPQLLQVKSWILVQFDSGESNPELAEWPQSYRTPSLTSLNEVKLLFLHQTIIHLVT